MLKVLEADAPQVLLAVIVKVKRPGVVSFPESVAFLSDSWINELPDGSVPDETENVNPVLLIENIGSAFSVSSVSPKHAHPSSPSRCNGFDPGGGGGAGGEEGGIVMQVSNADACC